MASGYKLVKKMLVSQAGGGDEPGGGGSRSGGQSSSDGIVVQPLSPVLLTTSYGFVSPKTGDTDVIYIMLALALIGIVLIGSGAIKNKR